jgi:leucyl-tRNA synthetase
MYIGGLEHSVLHLLYSRFITMAFHDFGRLPFEEPFSVFRGHGLITKDGAKMSKSKGNVVNPDEYIRAYGADAVRMYLAFLAPLTEGGDFRDAGIKGITRFLERVWKIANEKNFWKEKSQTDGGPILEKAVHETIRKVTSDTERLQYNTAISGLMILLGEFEKKKELVPLDHFRIFLKLLAPFAPFLAEELWQRMKKNGAFASIHRESWPTYDKSVLKESSFDLIVQVNGKMRGKISLPIGIPEKAAQEAVRALPAMKALLSQEPKRVIFVRDKLINFVI